MGIKRSIGTLHPHLGLYLPVQWPEYSAGGGESSVRGTGTALSFAITLGFMSLVMNEGRLTISGVLYVPACSFHPIDFGSGVS